MSQVCMFVLLFALVNGTNESENKAKQVCAITENIFESDGKTLNGHPTYGVNFAYKTEDECRPTTCSQFVFWGSHLQNTIKPSLKGQRCSCSGSGKKLFDFKMPIKEGPGGCSSKVCWDTYSTVMRIVKEFQTSKKTRASEWLMSGGHWKAECQEGGETVIPSIMEALAKVASGGKDITKFGKTLGVGMTEDMNEDTDDGEPEDDSNTIEEDMAKCPELAAEVEHAETRIDAEKDEVKAYTITKKEIEVNLDEQTLKIATLAAHVQEIIAANPDIAEKYTGGVCKLSEDREHHQFGVTFAYTTKGLCNSVTCNSRTLFAEMPTIIEGKKTRDGRLCECSLKGETLFKFSPSSMHKCGELGCWSFYSLISNIAYKFAHSGPRGEYPSSLEWLSSPGHFGGMCVEKAETVVPSPKDIVAKLESDGHHAAAARVLEMIELEKSHELMPEQQSCEVDNKPNSGEQEACPELAANLLALKEELTRQLSAKSDIKTSAEDLQLKIAGLQEEKAKMEKKLKAFIKLKAGRK